MNEKHYAQMYRALKRIKAYQSSNTLLRSRKGDWGIPRVEGLEMAYDNIQAEARLGLKGVRKPPDNTST